jgi:hypothetical protein
MGRINEVSFAASYPIAFGFKKPKYKADSSPPYNIDLLTFTFTIHLHDVMVWQTDRFKYYLNLALSELLEENGDTSKM